MNPELIDTESFTDPAREGVLLIPNFLDQELLGKCQSELHDPTRVKWRDNHSSFVNGRGLTIIQNHDVYALKLSDGDQSPMLHILSLVEAGLRARSFIRSLGTEFPSLENWLPDELSLHRYDHPEVGLSFHKDNLRFIGAIAIMALEGECDLVVRRQGDQTAYPTTPGDLVVLRAPGLIETDEDLRPEHAVLNLRTPTRTSMMLRQNNKPNERLSGFEFDNW